MSVHDRKAALAEQAKETAAIAFDPIAAVLAEIAEFKAEKDFQGRMVELAATFGVDATVVKVLTEKFGRQAIVAAADALTKGGKP